MVGAHRGAAAASPLMAFLPTGSTTALNENGTSSLLGEDRLSATEQAGRPFPESDLRLWPVGRTPRIQYTLAASALERIYAGGRGGDVPAERDRCIVLARAEY